jgi:serine/threonine protein kinase
LKPDNILVDNSEDRSRLLVADFGFSIANTPESIKNHPRCGTPGYIAPEII